MSVMLINQKAVRQLILDTAASERPGWKCTRVSRDALDEIDGRLRIAAEELTARELYDFSIVNDQLDETIERVVEIVGSPLAAS